MRQPFVERRPFSFARDGGAAVEFVIVLPLLSTLLFATIQFGSVLFVLNNMHSAARDAAREFAVGKLTTRAETEAHARNYLTRWGLAFDIQVALPGTMPAPDDLDVKVTISTPAAAAALVGFPPLWGNRALSVFAIFRAEG